MKRLTIIIFLGIFAWGFANVQTAQAQTGEELVNVCTKLVDDATYLKDYTVKLGAAAPGEDPPSQKKSLMLRKGTHYRFIICSSRDHPGRGILKVYSSSKLLVSNYVPATGKIFRSVDFKCQRTGPYHMWVEFEDGKEGLAVVILSFVKKL
jgi:hypothetical protein